MARRVRKTPWHHLSDEDLLKVRIRDLGVKIPGTDLQPRIRQLHQELADRDVKLRPVCYLADEWLCPNGQAVIGIPFFLAHPRLKALEFRMMFEVEGGTSSSCMRLLRHEAGHAIDHAYRLHQREDWQKVFGSPRIAYSPYFYMADPHSKKHVRNLPENYAQCHPEEDFAEAFAVWLNPHSSWKTRYEGWPAMRKLRYVERVMRELSRRPVPRRRSDMQFAANTLRSTLKSYYEKKFRLYQFGDLTFAVRDLKKIFRVSRAAEPSDTAALLIRRHKRYLVQSIAAWSGGRRGEIGHVVSQLAKMCEEHALVLRDGPMPSLVSVSTYVSTLVLNRLRAHRYNLR